MRKVRLAVAGLGNVGQAFIRQTTLPSNLLNLNRAGVELIVTGVATGRRGIAINRQGIDPKSLQTVGKKGKISKFNAGVEPQNISEFVEDVPADILLLLTPASPDGQPDIDLIKLAFQREMEVVTSNKSPLAWAFQKIMSKAEKTGRKIAYGATCLALNPPGISGFQSIQGATKFQIVVNATTNAIVNSIVEGRTYEEGLAQAQELGIAEPDPSDDVDGVDTQKKTVIAANTGMGANLTPKDVPTEGIRGKKFPALLKELQEGQYIQLLGTARKVGKGKVKAEVSPQIVEGLMASKEWRGTAMGGVIKTPRANITLHMPKTIIEDTGIRVFQDLLSILKGA